MTWNKLYKVSFLRENNIRCIPHHLCEDLFFTFVVATKCNTFVCTDKVTYQYIMYDQSATGGTTGWSRKFALMNLEALEKMCEYVNSDVFSIDKNTLRVIS